MTDETPTRCEFIHRGHKILLLRVVGQWIAEVHVTGQKPMHLTGVSEEATREMAETLVDELAGSRSKP